MAGAKELVPCLSLGAAVRGAGSALLFCSAGFSGGFSDLEAHIFQGLVIPGLF